MKNLKKQIIRESSSLKIARKAFGEKMFGVPDWQKLYGVNFTEEQIQSAQNFPWGREILESPCPFLKGKRIKDTHFPFLGIPEINGDPLTVAKWIKIEPDMFSFKDRGKRYYGDRDEDFFYEESAPWHKGQPHTDIAVLSFGWYLLLIHMIYESMGKKFEEQRNMLPREYEVPRTIEEVTKDILCCRKTEIFPNYMRGLARCRERIFRTDLVTNRDVIGRLSSVGGYWGSILVFYDYLGEGSPFEEDRFGMGASRKKPV